MLCLSEGSNYELGSHNTRPNMRPGPSPEKGPR